MAKNQTLQHKRSTTPGNQPTASQVAVGELAINLADRSIYTKNTTNTIIELARDITKSGTAPSSPTTGTLWYNTTTKELNFWTGTAWADASNTGEDVLPANTTVPAGFTGSGTSGSPYTITTTTPIGQSLNLGTFTITGLAPKQFVPAYDRAAAANGGRYTITNNIANDSGILVFQVIFNDTPTSAVGATYNAQLQIGTATVYINVNMTMASLTPPFPQTMNLPISTVPSLTAWIAVANTLTTTGTLEISTNGATWNQGPVSVTTSSAVYLRWAGDAGSGTGIDGAQGTTITGEVVSSNGATLPAFLTIDKTPDSFTFNSQTGVSQSTAITSNSVTISGVNSYVYLTSANTMEAAAGGGAFIAVPASGTSSYVLNGQTLQVRQTSSASGSTTTTVTISANGVTAPFAVTTMAAGVNTPSITTPTDGATGISASATVVASAYSVTGTVGAHLNSDWEIYNNSSLTGPTVASSMASTTNLTTWTPTGLSNGTQYWAQVRYRSNDGNVSSWSPAVSWTTIAGSINTPTITTPATNNTTGISLTAQIVSSAYSVTGIVGSHLNSDWELYSNSSLTTLVTSSMASTTNLTTWTPSGLLNATRYWVRVRYRSTDGLVSSWSPTRNWTTVFRPGIDWITRVSPTTTTLNSVAWNGTQFVAVGSNGVVITSTDGNTWSLASSGVSTDLNSVTAQGSLFVAVGLSGTIITSSDGTNWVSRSSGTSNGLYGVTSNGSLLLAVGWQGITLTSTDGINWTPGQTLSVTGGLNAVGWIADQSLFVAAGNDGELYISSDGTSWSGRSTPAPSSRYSIAGNSSTIIVAGVNSIGGTIASYDGGNSWSSLLGGIQSQFVYGIVWASSQSFFVAVGASGTISTSPDGGTWTSRTSTTTSMLYGIVWTGSKFVVVGGNGRIITSP